MSLTIDKLCVSIQKTPILKNINLRIEDGEFVSLLGASGCGKTTLLKSIAGLLELESGDIRLDEQSIVAKAPEKRGTVIVFQDLRLFPHMTVEKNIAFSMELRKVPKGQQKKRIEELLGAVHLEGFEKRKIREMSGGQRQRVAIARALAADPKVLLLDEPFSSLDENLRDEIGKLVKELHDKLSLTTIMVTHNKEEAMRYSDHIALMKDGEILQYDTPTVLFTQPLLREVADYTGDTNYIIGSVSDGVFESRILTCKTDKAAGMYELMLRPGEIKILLEASQNGKEKTHQIAAVMFQGEDVEITLESQEEQGSRIMTRMRYVDWQHLGLEQGDGCTVVGKTQNPVLFPVEETR